MTDSVRLQKYLADRGVASRRAAADIVRAGRVKINDKTVTEPGSRVIPGSDTVSIDGVAVNSAKERVRTIILNKPRGYVCSTAGQSSPTVYSLIVGIKERLVPVGRLDKDSEGLLLMSNDGDLVNRLTHPRFGHEKVYEATVSGAVSANVLKTLRSRMVIDGYRIQPVQVRILRESSKKGQTILEFLLKEGRNRQIREMCRRTHLKVLRLVRTRIGKLTLSDLPTGKWREIDPCEAGQLSL
ncbi:MAG: rRNA pseudouridine synthase [Lentisphaerae bacterium]|nr:rRNA pseudouridine synthase [Lentisphaerota bacterium]